MNQNENITLIVRKVKQTTLKLWQSFLRFIYKPGGKTLNYKRVGIVTIGVLVVLTFTLNLTGSGSNLPDGYELPNDIIIEQAGDKYYYFDESADEYYLDSAPDKDGYTPRYHISKIIAPELYTKNQNESYQADWSLKVSDDVYNRVRKKSFIQNGK